MVRRTVASSRFFIAIAVLGTFVAAVALLVYGALAVAEIVWDTIAAGEVSASGAKQLAVDFIELIDVFLLGTVLYIVALGLYELFVDPALPVPTWLRVDSLDDLKAKLIQVVVVLLGVSFLGSVVEWNGDAAIIELGAAVALVIAAFGLILFVGKLPTKGGNGPPEHE